MFDIGFSEVLLIAVVALVAIGPEDLPGILFRLGRMMRQVRMFMGNLRDQYSEIMHEAEVDHYRKTMSVNLMDEAKADQNILPKPDIIEHDPEVMPETAKDVVVEEKHD